MSDQSADQPLAATQDVPPDRLSNDTASPYYNEAVLERGVGVRFNGIERNNIDEYCVSEGWVKMAVGKTVDRKGRPITLKSNGVVEPYFQDLTRS